MPGRRFIPFDNRTTSVLYKKRLHYPLVGMVFQKEVRLDWRKNFGYRMEQTDQGSAIGP
jgi:hypothetical protein